MPRLRRFLAEGSARAVAFRLVRFRLRQAEEALRVLEGGRTAPPWDETRARQHLNQIVEHRAARLVEVDQPLVLISQIQRSGGTLLSQLFDHHPQLHAHPHELHTGHPNKEAWPALDMKRPGDWFPTLYERPAKRSFNEGYRKLVSLKAAGDGAKRSRSCSPRAPRRCSSTACWPSARRPARARSSTRT